jgi:hypothetical protein
VSRAVQQRCASLSHCFLTTTECVSSCRNLCGRSLESLGRCCVDWRWVSPRWLPPRSDVLLFAAGVGAILHCYSDSNGVHRDVFR